MTSLGPAAVTTGLPALTREQIDDALSLWRPGGTRAAIVDFLDAVVNGPDAVPPELRVAAFDHDGTMVVEKPTESVFLFLRWWAEQDLSGHTGPLVNAAGQVARALHGLGVHVPLVHRPMSGHTVEEYQQTARTFLGEWRHPRFGRLWPELVYAPMLQLVDLLHRLDFGVWLVSGSSRDYLRVMSGAYHVGRSDILGTELPVRWRHGRLERVMRPVHTMMGARKPAAVWEVTGRRPLLAVGNTRHDVPMLESARFAMMVRHDDAAREFAYADEGAEREAARRGWPVVSIRDDFAEVFGPAGLTEW